MKKNFCCSLFLFHINILFERDTWWSVTMEVSKSLIFSCCAVSFKKNTIMCHHPPVLFFWSPTNQEACLPNATSHPWHVFNVTGKNVLMLRNAGKMSEWGILCSCSVMRPSQPISYCCTPLIRTGSVTWKQPTSTGRPTLNNDKSWWGSPAR